jgi:threonine dehydrogenase-like Zn-dependent dehydrogenase
MPDSMICYALDRRGFHRNDVPIPVPEKNEVLIRTLSCGICTGDLFAYRNRDRLTEPTFLGHEGTGVIVENNAKDSTYSVGDVVTSLHGAYAQYFTDDIDAIAAVPANLDPLRHHGEPVACFVHASGRFGPVPARRAAIIGCGYMGLGCLQMVAISGAGEIVALDIRSERRGKAVDLGAARAVSPDHGSPEEIREEMGEFDLVVEAAGTPSAIDLATALVAQHGRIVLVGYHQSGGGMRNVDMRLWNYKAIDVVNGHIRRQDEKHDAMMTGLERMESGDLKMADLVTPYPHQAVQRAFEDLDSGVPGLFKASLVFDDG